MARDLTNAILATPNQASTIFGVGGAHPLRQKSLFVMRFLRTVTTGSDSWRDGLSFLVKSIDRPTVTPTIEEVNQYNRKRLIQTGIKYQPVNVSFYDTADGAAMNMWLEYAAYYYGDYRQTEDGYRDDIIDQTFRDPTTQGFGFGIKGSSSSSDTTGGADSQFFFNKIEIFQVWGNQYTSYELLNPKITNFDPDDLSYEDSGASTIQMTLNYEAIYHDNGGKPQPISGNQTLIEIFGGDFNGETYDPVLGIPLAPDFTSTTPLSTTTLSPSGIASLLGSNDQTPLDISTLSGYQGSTTSSGGALSKFGNFDFGDFTSLGTSLPTEISTLTSTSGAFPSGLTTQQLNLLELQRLTSQSTPATQAALGSSISDLPDVASALGISSTLTGTSPIDQVQYSDVDTDAQDIPTDFSWSDAETQFAQIVPLDDGDGDVAPAQVNAVVSGAQAPRKGGLALSPLTMAVLNARSDGSSQIGLRARSTVNPLLAYIVEPTPASVLSPDLVYGRAHLLKPPFVMHSSGSSFPKTITATISRPIPIALNILAYSTVSGSAVGHVIIGGHAVILNSISGKINASVSPVPHMVGIVRAEGGIARNIVISAVIHSTSTVRGTLGEPIIISGSAVGNVRNRAGTVNASIRINAAVNGITLVSGSLNKPILVSAHAVINLPLRGTVSASIKITPIIASTFIMKRSATITGVVLPSIIATSIVKNPVAGSIHEAITIRSMTSGRYVTPITGSITKQIIVIANIHG